MASLKDIRRRIHSIDNIRQITKSMEMIAAARFQRAHLKAIYSKKYLEGMRELVSHLTRTKSEGTHPLLKEGEGAHIAIILVATDRGLCGAYNSNLFNLLDTFLKSHPKEEIELVLFGRKAIDYYRKKKWAVAFEIPDWGGKITSLAIEKLTGELIEKFLAGAYRSIRLIYTEHQTIFSRKIVERELLPIQVAVEGDSSQHRDYIFEPNIEELFGRLLPHYCVVEIQNMLNQAYASELAARMSAMRAAATNAEEIREKLLLERNKLRQGGITKEVLEISSGSQAT